MSKIENISIGFFGTSIFALKSLSKLYENQFNIKFVVSQTLNLLEEERNFRFTCK